MDGSQQVGIRLKVIGFGDPAANDWLVVNQFAIQGTRYNLRPDLVVYVNGLPLAVIELKNPADHKADIWAAFNQLQTYTNNAAERALRQSVIQRKISHGVQSRQGAICRSRLLTVTTTLRQQVRDVWQFLEQAWIAHHRGGVMPSLLPDP
jgi:type I restriction enzyme R subunit